MRYAVWDVYGKVSSVSSRLIPFRMPALSEDEGPECAAELETH